MKSVSFKPIIRYRFKINFLVIQYCYIANMGLVNDRKIHKKESQNVCPGHNWWPWQYTISTLNTVKVESSSISQFFSLPLKTNTIISPLKQSFRHYIYRVFLSPNAYNKILMLFSPCQCVFYNLDQNFKPQNDGFNLIYCKKQWIGIKRLGVPKFWFCLYHEGDKLLHFARPRLPCL